MRYLVAAVSGLALAVSAPALAGPDKGKKDKSEAKFEKKQHKGKSAKHDKDRYAQRPYRDAKDFKKAEKRYQKEAKKEAKQYRKEVKEYRKDRREAQSDRDFDRRDTRRYREARRDYRDDVRRDRIIPVYVREDGRFRFDRDRDDYYVIQGCPPGLAKRGNGCVPPGQARNIFRDGSNGLANYLGLAPRFRDGDYRYSNGYAYRVDSGSNLIDAFLPLVGGALFQGNQWPVQYNDNRVPAYYGSFYGRDDDYAYRYADRTIFQVDPQTRAIQGISGLLTGDDFTVGQRMPAGYDAYNVPYNYRDRYYDRPDANYRYSDGYVYQVDPTTQLIQTAIKLLT